MADPTVELERLLSANNAVLIRDKKHYVYRLPNGNKFTMAKTPSDHRALRNHLANLRRALGPDARVHVEQHFTSTVPTLIVEADGAKHEYKIGSEGVREVQTAIPVREQAVPVPPPAVPVAPIDLPAPVIEVKTAPVELKPAPAPLVEVKTTAGAPLRARIEETIAAHKAKSEALLAEAQKLEKVAEMLGKLLDYADDPASEVALAALVPPPPPPVVVVPEPEPVKEPEPIIEAKPIKTRVQVTRQLVYAASQTFGDETFTVDSMLDRMTSGEDLEPEERRRVRSSVANAMVSLLERGEILKLSEGNRGTPARWKRFDPSKKHHAQAGR